MRISALLAVIAVIVGLSGCASTVESPQGTTETDTSVSAGPSSVATSKGIGGGGDVGQSLAGGTAAGSNSATDIGRPDTTRSVYYEFDKYDVKGEYRALVETHARWLRANPKARLTIEGNTDEHGSREYNVALGQRRAESVTALMVLMGVKREQIEAVSFGKEKPRAVGHDEAAWAENRRSDFADR
jgi:peptidoglycan-associated lipoprotein